MATEVKSFWKTLYVDECWAWKFAVLLFIHVAFAAKILRGPRTGGRNSSVLQQENNQLAHCLAQNEVSFKLAYLCDIFAEVNKLHVSMQGPYKTMLDVSNKIAAFNEKLSLWKRDITSGVSRGERGNNCPGAEWLREARKSPNNVTTRRATRGVHLRHLLPRKFHNIAYQFWHMQKLSKNQWRADGGRTGRQPRAFKAGGHPKSEITKR